MKRNIERFPQEFIFQLAKEEYEILMPQIAISSSGYGGRRKLPLVFTEQGVAMLSGVLRSDAAVKMSIQVISAFAAMRKFIFNNAKLFQRIDAVEKRQMKHEIQTEEKFEMIFDDMQGIC